MSFSSEELARTHIVIYSGDIPDFSEKIKKDKRCSEANSSHRSKFQSKQKNTKSRSSAVNMKVFHKCDYGDKYSKK